MRGTAILQGRRTLRMLGRRLQIRALRKPRLLPLLGGMLVLFPVLPYAQDISGQQPEMPPARRIPGITAEDRYPQGCVDCHINYEEMNRDTRLSTLIDQWATSVPPKLLEEAQAIAGPNIKLKGVHPRLRGVGFLGGIPAVCVGCHEHEAKTAPRLVPLLHKIHLAGGDEGVFLTVFQGECTHCHKLDKATGQWRVPSGPED
jgi:hypothetical protein